MTRLRRLLLWLAGMLALALSQPSEAQTRRAFLVGMERYADGNIQRLSRSISDARDLAADLEQVGFDKKNIKVVADLKSKKDFQKEFDAFLKTVQEGDVVLFFYSGHGFGVELDRKNYILFGDLRSPVAFTRAHLPDEERRNADVIRLRVPSFMEAYQSDEITKSGLSEQEIQQQIAARKPRAAILVLDACRSLLVGDPGTNAQRLRRGPDSGSRLIAGVEPPPGFVVLYSASFGETAVESFGAWDKRRNSLFTEVLRTELLRPGQTLPQLAARTRLMVRSIADSQGAQQEPDFVQNLKGADDFYFVEPIGAERFTYRQAACEGAKADWEQIARQRRRDFFERHRRRFDGCETAELARRALVNLADTATDAAPAPVAAADRRIDECDRLAAAEHDRARPPEVPGVPLERVEAEEAIAACTKAVEANPRIIRFLFNLGRAHYKRGADPSLDEAQRLTHFRRARLTFEDAQKRGYLAALNNLAILYDAGDGVDVDEKRADDLWKSAAQQGHPLAMYNLAIRYQTGKGSIQRDHAQAYEWFVKAAESGFVPAMVETGAALASGLGVPSINPRRAVEWFERAAAAGSNQARVRLGRLYANGRTVYRGNAVSPDTIDPDPSLALIWYGRAAEAGDSAAQHQLASIMEGGQGLPNRQPEIGERYWRLAAYGGVLEAEVELAEKLRTGAMLVKPENGAQEAIDLLKRAMSLGATRAALELARIYRTGEFGQVKNPVEAMRLAYHAIKLATEADPTTADGDPFYEIAAGHLLAEMAKGGEAVDPASGRPLLSKDETDRLEYFYGQVDPASGQVKARRLRAPLDCTGYTRTVTVWVWDWGRKESPTEQQLRRAERENYCYNNQALRETLVASFELSKKNKIPFADLIEQQIKTAKASADAETTKKKR